MEKQKKLALYPIYLYEDGFELPKGGYYLITANGIYFHKETKVGSGLVKVNGIPWLEPVDVSLALNLPKIPVRIVAQALTFFRKVFEVHGAEAYVTLLYSSKLGQYRLWAPKQSVTAASVNYDRGDQPPFQEREAEDWQMVGTIHSHCDFGAYHSSTDTHDESTFDGIHITLGHVNKDRFSMAVSIAFNNQREQMELENCCLGVTRVSNTQVSSSRYMTWGDATYFEFEMTPGEKQQSEEDAKMIEMDWMHKVEHGWKKYRNYDDDNDSFPGGGSGRGRRRGWYDQLGFGYGREFGE